MANLVVHFEIHASEPQRGADRSARVPHARTAGAGTPRAGRSQGEPKLSGRIARPRDYSAGRAG